MPVILVTQEAEISPGWLWTVILLISDSWVAGITGVSHWRLAPFCILTSNAQGFHFPHILDITCYCLCIFFVCACVAILGFELRASHLPGRSSISWAPLHPFCSGYFGERVLLFDQAGLYWDPLVLCFLLLSHHDQLSPCLLPPSPS
jgi:hypothetical protein